jgi:hypothetical protein
MVSWVTGKWAKKQDLEAYRSKSCNFIAAEAVAKLSRTAKSKQADFG